jgi:RNase adapter protein RapZ
MKKKSSPPLRTELVIITGLSGSGKGTVLKALEDIGYYAVDNLPIDLIPKFAQLAKDSPNIRRAALVVDIREGTALKRFPALFKKIRKEVATRLVFLEADDATLIRRFSETRRPHPLGADQSVAASVRSERERLAPIRELADPIIQTSKFNVHELRETIHRTFGATRGAPDILVQVNSFGYRHGVPPTATWFSTYAFCRTLTTFRNSRIKPARIRAWRAISGRSPKRGSSSSASRIC